MPNNCAPSSAMPTAPDAHRGGCLYCRHWAAGRCAHPAYALARPTWAAARDDETRCGTAGRLWAPLSGARGGGA